MKISDLARATDTPTETIRYYEREGLLPRAARTEGNYRIYDAVHLERLAFIRRCRSLDMTQDEIRVLLRFRDTPSESCEDVNTLLDAHINHVADRIRELLQLEKQLLTLRECCRDGRQAADCGILNELSQGATEVSTPSASESHLSATHAGGRQHVTPRKQATRDS